MSDRPRERSGPGASTRAVHAGERDQPRGSAVTTPIHQTSTFWFEDSAELRAFAERRLPPDEYGRYGNRTWRAVDGKICDLEGAEQAVLFGSGMCAATTTFLALLPKGGHIIVTNLEGVKASLKLPNHISQSGPVVAVNPDKLHVTVPRAVKA